MAHSVVDTGAPDDVAYSETIASVAPLCILAQSAVASRWFEWEMFVVSEVIGSNVYGKTPSHEDIEGAQAVIRTLQPKTVSASVPTTQSGVAQVMRDIGATIASGARMVTPQQAMNVASAAYAFATGNPAGALAAGSRMLRLEL